MIPYLFAFFVICVYLGVIWLLLFVIVLSLYLLSSGVNRKDASTKQLGAGLLWLSVSILLPRFTKKHNLINRKWMRWLLVFLSPAAILTLYLPAFFLFSLDLPCKCMLLGTWGEDVSRQMINSRAGVDFPSMSFVTGNTVEEFPDFENNCTMRLKNSADQSFLQEIEDNKEWEKDSSNPNLYKREVRDWENDTYESMVFDTTKGLLIIKYVKM